MIKVLIDTGACKNFIDPRFVKERIENEAIVIRQLNGSKINITHHIIKKLVTGMPTKYFITLEGLEGLCQLGIIPDVVNKEIILRD